MYPSRSVVPLFAVGLFALVSARQVWAVEATARAAALHSITTDQTKIYVDALANDTFEGREAGSRGGRAAANYIVDNLKRFGLHGAGPKGSFYQNFREYHNILTAVEGRDPQLKDQYIVIGAHYDHVGYGNARNSYGPFGHIHNGADDNASGVSALLEVAEAVSMLPEAPRRSILIAFWDGEEKGLLGSEHWAQQPTVPLKRVAVAMNADMVGRLRNSAVDVFGVRTSPGLRELVSRQNDVPNLTVDFNWQIRPDSDHQSFYSRGIPIVMMHTGMHGDYHRPSDDADKINAEGVKQVAQLMFGVLVELADAPALGGFRRESRSESRSTQQRVEVGLPQAPGRLGVRWDVARAAADGTIVVTSVTPGSAAAVGGIQRGDRLLTFAGRDVQGAEALRLAALAASNPVVATVERKGSEEPVEVKLQLPGEPVRLGISWRVDAAEPNAVIVNRVTPGSPADAAGLRVNDRIYAVNGQDFADATEMRDRATQSEGAVTLEVETAGRVRTVEVPGVEDQMAKLSKAEAPEDSGEDAER